MFDLHCLRLFVHLCLLSQVMLYAKVQNLHCMAQFAPLDTPMAIDRFLGHWKPNAIIIMENELWPNLIMCAAELLVILGPSQCLYGCITLARH